MLILPLDDERSWLRTALSILEAGGIVAYPTDTLYGLAVDPRRDDAVEGLFRAKARDAGVPVPLIAGTIEQARAAGALGGAEERLAQAFWPGPLSLVVPASALVSRKLLGAGGTVAVRVPARDVARELAGAFGCALTATSANVSGSPAAVTAAEVAAGLHGRIDAVIDGGRAPSGAPSTIVAITAEGPRLLRAGAVPWERVLEFLQ